MFTADAQPELVFALADGQNRFFVELAEAFCFELKRIGANARLCIGECPDPAEGLVHVFIPPHEFVALAELRPTAGMLKRSIVISAEQPASGFFDTNVELARDAGAVFDISPRAIRAYRSKGITAEHLQLGYTELWERSATAVGRDIDVLFLGRLTGRRAQALASYAGVLERFRCHLVLSDNSRPNRGSTADFAAGGDKRDLLSRSKVLINIHAEQEPYFEWLRVTEAISAGCAVVSENSTDVAPLQWGEHVITGRLDVLGLFAAWMVDDEQARSHITESARRLLSEDYPLSRAALKLAEAACRVDKNPLEITSILTTALRRKRSEGQAEGRLVRQPPHTVGLSEGEGRILRALKTQHFSLLSLRRQLDRFEVAIRRPTEPQPRTLIAAKTPTWDQVTAPTISVIAPVYNHPATIVEALESVRRSSHRSWEIVVVDDSSSDNSGEAVRMWMAEHPECPVRLVCHEVNQGLAQARNTGVAYARAGLLLMLDSDNLLRRRAMSKLLAALRRDPDASFAYGILERFSPDGAAGLVSAFGWDPERFRQGNYIDALALIRREALEAVGGYSLDTRLALGWEDYDLWVRLAESNCHGVFVPEMIARYRAGHSSMVSVTNISPTDAYAAIADHAPGVMRELKIPL